MTGLKDRVAIITGAGRGIGQGVALRFAQEGARLILNDLDEGPLGETVREAQERGAQATGITGSVNDTTLAERLVQQAIQEFGDIHAVVTCAGFTWDGMLHRTTDEQWQAIIDTHLTGTFRMVREAFRFMREQAKAEQQRGETPESRRIITIASSSAFGNLGQVNYSAAKAGIIGLTKTTAIEGAPFNILANTLAFGLIDTRLTREREQGEVFQERIPLGIPKEAREKALENVPLRRPGTVEEAVGPILFLASNESSYMTGHVLEVNGGGHM